MSINRIDFQGAFARTADVSPIKQNADNKGMVDQSNFQMQLNKEVDQKSTTVTESNKSEKDRSKFDAKEKGDNEYAGDGGKRRNQEDKAEKESFFFDRNGRRMDSGSGSFDMKI